MRLFLTILVTTAWLTSSGQELIAPFEGGIPPSINCYVIKTDGTRLDGKTRFAINGARGLKSLSLTTDDGEKITFRAKDLSEVGFKNNQPINAISVLQRAESLRKLNETDWENIFDREYIIYRQVLLPSGKKATLMQLLNPGFDSKLKIFYSQGSAETSGIGIPLPIGLIRGVKITGGKMRACWVLRDGGKLVKIRKGNYNKRCFERLFGNSEQMKKEFDRPYRFADLPLHVFRYTQLENVSNQDNKSQ